MEDFQEGVNSPSPLKPLDRLKIFIDDDGGDDDDDDDDALPVIVSVPGKPRYNRIDSGQSPGICPLSL